MKRLDRRTFLKALSASAVAGTSWGTMGSLQLANAAASLKGVADYKALVCIYLDGGADSYNLLVPRVPGTGNPATDYNTYTSSRTNMAVGYDEDMQTWDPSSILTLNGTNMGLNPAMTGLQALYNTGDMAVVSNVGMLMENVTRQQILNGTANLPPQLFSHSDQSIQWHAGHAGTNGASGWFGRAGDLLHTMNATPGPSMNISITGNNVMQVGDAVFPYSVNESGPSGLFTGWWEPNAGPVRDTAMALAAASSGMFGSEHAAIKQRAHDNFLLIDGALQTFRGDPDDDGNYPDSPLFGVFPDTYLGNQLRMVAEMIGIRNDLGAQRQTFFVRLGSWDTHDAQNEALPELIGQLDSALSAFYQATVNLGVANDVTAFTQSEFSRTMNSNGLGTDHGWGGHQFVVGGAVNGGQIYGTLPDLTLEGPDDFNRGRIIPTLATEQYGATLASWFGVSAGADMNTVFPNLGEFSPNTLGFV